MSYLRCSHKPALITAAHHCTWLVRIWTCRKCRPNGLMPYASAIYISCKNKLLGWITHLFGPFSSPGYFTSIPITLVHNGPLLPTKSLQIKNYLVSNLKTQARHQNCGKTTSTNVQNTYFQFTSSSWRNFVSSNFCFPTHATQNCFVLFLPQGITAKPLLKGEKQYFTRQFMVTAMMFRQSWFYLLSMDHIGNS